MKQIDPGSKIRVDTQTSPDPTREGFEYWTIRASRLSMICRSHETLKCNRRILPFNDTLSSEPDICNWPTSFQLRINVEA